ncbi:MAG TPA: hypothetical protein VJG32_17735 [Anaerolineae bacterium]|nr:hypothetical protein [Anaerolineae bacterium]
MPRKNNRGRIAAVTLICTGFLIVLALFQNAAAVGQRQEPITLKPPFTLEVDDRVSANDFSPVLPSASRLLTETFGGGFDPTVGVTGTTTAWRVFIDSASDPAHYWERVIPALSSTYADTAWAPCGLCDGSDLDPDTDNYPANVGAWLIYGPVNLSNYYAAEVVFNYQLALDPSVDGSGFNDFFFFGASDDGTRFTGSKGAVTGSSWQTRTLYLGDHVGKSSVYLGFYFHSDGAANNGKGAFIDNVSLRAMPYLNTFLPSVASNFAAATPAPSSLYLHTFSVGGDNDPDFVAWGQKYTSLSGGSIIYEQNIQSSGNPGSSMYLFNTQIDQVTLAGPNLSVSGNYEISADFNVTKGKDNARYGLIFGAEGGAFGRSGSTPTFNIDTHYYKFSLQFDPGDDDPDDFQLERCETNGKDCVDLIPRTTIPSGAAADGAWDTVAVRRSGASIVLLINGVQIGSASDGSYTGARKFGLFIQSGLFNNGTNPLRVSFDNYRVGQLP